MDLTEIALLLFLVVDPFGNLPFVLSILDRQDPRAYAWSISREVLMALLILVAFALAGDRILQYLHVDRSSLSVAGGVILFLISLKMIFETSSAIFEDRYRDDPFLVPIAVPSIAGPSALTTVIILRTREHVPLVSVLLALLAVMLLTWVVFLLGRGIGAYLGARGVNAMEKFMGLLLNLVAVNMVLSGVRDFLA